MSMILAKMLERGTVPHLLLFIGPPGQKEEVAEAFAKKLLSSDLPTHPDLYIYQPEGKIGLHSIETMRQFSQEVYLPPYSAERKVFVIHEAERMLTYSSNALLKTFEEPAKTSTILLLTSRPSSLLPTVVSRCFALRFENSVSPPPLHPTLLEVLSNDRLPTYSALMEKAAQLSDEIEKQQAELETTLWAEAESKFPDGLSASQKHAMEKEINGAISMQLLSFSEALLTQILGWYRDMHLIHVRGDKTHLFYPEHAERVDQALQHGALLPLEQVEKAIDEARLALARSTSLTSCLENLLLKIKKITG